MQYEIQYLTENDDILFAQIGECWNELDAVNKAWYFLGFSNAPSLRLYVYSAKDYDPEELSNGEFLGSFRHLTEGSTAERETKRHGSLRNWIDMFRGENKGLRIPASRPMCIWCDRRNGVACLLSTPGDMVYGELICLPCLTWLDLPDLPNGDRPPLP